MVVLSCRCLSLCPPQTVLWLVSSSFPCPDSSTRLLCSETRLWKRDWFTFFFPAVAIYVVVSSVDSSTRVSWMLRQCLKTQRRRRLDRQARSRGNKEPKQLSTKPPYSSDGGRTYSLARKSAIHVQRSECTTTVKSSEYPIPRPGEHYHIIIITDYNKSCSCVPCLSH